MLIDTGINLTPVQPTTPEHHAQKEACLKYREMSRHRPPFEFEAPDPKQSGLDEKMIFNVESDVFGVTGLFAENFSGTGCDDAYGALIKAKVDLESGIEAIKRYDGYHEEDTALVRPVAEEIESVSQSTATTAAKILGWIRSLIPTAPKEQIHPAIQSDPFAEEKLLWERHYRQKQRYLQCALRYLYVAEHYKTEESDKLRAKHLRQEVYAIFIGHQGLVYARSAGHGKAPLREDGDAKIKHSYRVCIRGFNSIMERIKGAENEDEIDHLFEELHLEMIGSLFHDTLRDSKVTPEDLLAKIIELLNLDFKVSGPMRRDDDPEHLIPAELNFAVQHAETIVRELIAGRKPDDKEERSTYIERQILSGLEEPERSRVFVRKVRSRADNIMTLRHRDPVAQVKVIYGALDLIGSGLFLLTYNGIHGTPTHPDLLTELQNLCLFCYQETERIARESTYADELSSDQRDVITAMLATNQRVFIGYHEKLLNQQQPTSPLSH